MGLKLVIFDLDGTLLDSPLDFDAIRCEIGLPDGQPILEALEGLPPPERARAEAVINRHETEAVRASHLIPGATDLLAWLRARGLKVALLTRNSRASVEAAARRHGLAFDAAVTREDHEPKPSPHGVRHLMEACGAPPRPWWWATSASTWRPAPPQASGPSPSWRSRPAGPPRQRGRRRT